MTTPDPTPTDCCGREPQLHRLDQLLSWIEREVHAVAAAEPVPLSAALGRVLAQDQCSALAVPPFDNSAMDGWALRRADLTADGPTRLPIGGRIAAGHPLTEPSRPGHAYRIFTGAPVPPGLDAVAMQEDCREDDGHAVLPAGIRAGANIRRAGESVAIGDVPLTAGTRLWPQHIGVAATLGLTVLPVRRPLRVATFSTGDEVFDPGQPLPPGGIYDANRFTLAAMLQALGCLVSDLGILPDRLDALTATLAEAEHGHDLIMTSGGVSVGDEDHVKAAVQARGEVVLWRLALKPGKPLALGRIGTVPFLGLPGNPVAVMVTFLLVARPMIARLSGLALPEPRRYPLPAAFTLNKKIGRREFPRARVNAAGGVELLPSESSGVLTSMTAAETPRIGLTGRCATGDENGGGAAQARDLCDQYKGKWSPRGCSSLWSVRTRGETGPRPFKVSPNVAVENGLLTQFLVST